MYKNKDTQKEANRLANQRYRQKGITQGITQPQGITQGITQPQGITQGNPFVIPDGMTESVTQTAENVTLDEKNVTHQEGVTGVTDKVGSWHEFGSAYYRALAKQRGDAVEETPPGYGWIDFIKSCTPEFLRDIELAGVRRGDRKARYERVYRYWLKSQGIKVEPAPDKRLTKLSQALDRDLSGLMGKENMLDLVFRGALSMRQTRAPGT